MPNQLCTALTEESGTQFLSFSIGVATPGADDALPVLRPRCGRPGGGGGGAVSLRAAAPVGHGRSIDTVGAVARGIRTGRVRRWALAAGGLTAVLAGCAKDAPQDTLQPEGSNAQKIQNLHRVPADAFASKIACRKMPELLRLFTTMGVLMICASGRTRTSFPARPTVLTSVAVAVTNRCADEVANAKFAGPWLPLALVMKDANPTKSVPSP